MDIIFSLLRQIVIEHMAHMVNVQSASGHIGGDQYGKFACGEILEYPLSFVLSHVTGQGAAAKPVADKIGLDAFGGSFGVDEDDRTRWLQGFQ